jgi:hypothetical protein
MQVPDGRISVTFGVLADIPMEDVLAALDHHARKTLDMRPKDAAQALRDLRDGPRRLSVLQSSGGVKFWVLTEGDRPLTTVLLPHEY